MACSFSEAWIKEKSVAVGRVVCLMEIASLFLNPSDPKAVPWATGSRLSKVVQLYCLTCRPNPTPSAPGQTLHHKHAQNDTSGGVWAITPLQIKGSDFIMSPYQTATRQGYLYDKATFLLHAFSWVIQERWMKKKGSGWWPWGQGLEDSSWSHYLLIDWFSIQPIVFDACPLFCSSIKMHRFLSAISLLVDRIS